MTTHDAFNGTGLIGQFRRPHGVLGALAGWIMAHRSSNIGRNRWTVELLGLPPGAQVLEIGCGPGIGLAAALAAVQKGHVTGLDHSELMIRQAARRHTGALKADRLELWQGTLESLPHGTAFDAVFSCNVLQFVANRQALLAEVKTRLRPGGAFATTYQPRGQCASAEEGRAWIGQIAEDLCAAGFLDVEVREKHFGDMPAFCALAVVPEKQSPQ